MQISHFRNSKLTPEVIGKEITGLEEKPSPWMRDCGLLSKAPLICHPVPFSRQAWRKELLSEIPAGWRAEEGKTLSDSTFKSCWPESSCPHRGGRPVLAQHI